MLLQANKKTIITLISVIILTITVISPATAATIPLYYGDIKKGDIPVIVNTLGQKEVAIDETVKALGLVRTANKEGIVISFCGSKLEFWNSSPVARAAGRLISFPKNIEIRNGHWWGDMKSVEEAVKVFYNAIGKKKTVKFGSPNNKKNDVADTINSIIFGTTTTTDSKVKQQPTQKKTVQVPTKTVPTPKKNVPQKPKQTVKKPVVTTSPKPATPPKINNNTRNTHLSQNRTRPIVVIDAGHGGKDSGTSHNGAIEKHIALKAAKILKNKLDNMGIDARLTRSTDVYLKLSQRTAIANRNNANVFVSLHCNAVASSKKVSGLEYYIMALPSDKDAMRLAVAENRELGDSQNKNDATKKSDRKTTMLLKILGDMQQNHKIDDSTKFAEYLCASSKSNGIKPRRVAQAPFFVLRGAGMPAVLIEMGYVTDSVEAKKLKTDAYLNKLCNCFANGIVQYIKDNPVVTR